MAQQSDTERRVMELLSEMTIEEKVAQMVGIPVSSLVGATGLDRSKLERRLQHGVGQLSMATLLGPEDPDVLVEALNGVQRFLVEETRLGIPAIAHAEALSGLVHPRAASFPTAIALGATWDPDLVEAICDTIRQQMCSVGIRQALSPVLDVARDPRWGRMHETYGEDPYLCSALGIAFVRGLQGSELGAGVVATGKHFVGYGASEGGRNRSPVSLSDRELMDVYCRPFEAAIRVSGLRSVMSSYSTLNGEAPSGSIAVLGKLLRDQLGFDGFVVSDYGAVADLFRRQLVVKDPHDAAILAASAGTDVELPDPACYGRELAKAVREGEIAESVIDASVGRVLRTKVDLGLIDRPFVRPGAWRDVFDRPSDRDLTSMAAERSIVLLANDGLLPLGRDRTRIAVIGPNANSVRNLFSGYTAPAELELRRALARHGVGGIGLGDDVDFSAVSSVFSAVEEQPDPGDLEAISALYPNTPTVLDAVRSAAPTTEVLFAHGCAINGPARDGIAEAVEAARVSEVAIVVLGDKTGWSGDATSGENRDRSTLDLPGSQCELLDAVCTTGTPVVVVLVNGRVAPLRTDSGRIGAIVEAWQPGAAGGAPIAAVLFGDAEPGGRLPVTIPRQASQVPAYHSHLAGAGYGTPSYTDGDWYPCYPFGHGLSYADFRYGHLEVEPEEVPTTGSLEVRFEIENVSGRAGEEVPQLYLGAHFREVSRPGQQLVGFARTHLEPGEMAGVTLEVPLSLLAFRDSSGKLVVEPGPVNVMVGRSSEDIRLRGSVDVIGGRAEVDGKRDFLSTTHVRTRG